MDTRTELPASQAGARMPATIKARKTKRSPTHAGSHPGCGAAPDADARVQRLQLRGRRRRDRHQQGQPAPPLQHQGRARRGDHRALRQQTSRGAGARSTADKHAAPERLARYAQLYADVLAQDRLCLGAMLAAEFVTLPQPMQKTVRQFFKDLQAAGWSASSRQAAARARSRRRAVMPMRRVCCWADWKARC